MSGTSLDGLDLAYCEFSYLNGKWNYRIEAAETIPYNKDWKVRLGKLHEQPIFLYPKTDIFYGRYIGKCINEFISRHGIKPDLISSHGHTIFHNPEEGYTSQIGHGGAIAVLTGIPVVNDFRTQDVVLGGQGAPLVPIGDEMLFGEYDACLNLGGIANISYREKEIRNAFDISPCNLVLNYLANQLNLPYDQSGEIAKSGIVNHELLSYLNNIEYYKLSPPKSLGREWVDKFILHKITTGYSIENALATLVEHISTQISKVFIQYKINSVLVTGGGSFNTFLIDSIQEKWSGKLILPDTKMIQFKESLIFAFLGVLRIRNDVNVLKTYTGASKNSSSGAVYGF